MRSLHRKRATQRRGLLWASALFCAALLQILIVRGKLSSYQMELSSEDLSFDVALAAEGHDHGLAATLLKYEKQNGPKESIVASPGPFLVVCDNMNPALAPMFSNFTLVRLKHNETPPEWSSVAFLEPGKCNDHPYVKEAMRRREQSSFLTAPEVSSVENGTWLHGVHWPNFSSNRTKYLRMTKDRPVILKIWGEVFWRHIYVSSECGADIVVYREVEVHATDCLTMHFLQGVSSALSAKDRLEQEQISTVQHDKFCSMIVRYNSSQPAKMFQKTNYDIDAIVRHMFFLQLSKYKPCKRILDCPGGPDTAFKCMEGYKFHITMENSLIDGYVSEKIFNGARGGGIPVYFGASDINKYINPQAFVHCNVSRKVIEVMRIFYPRHPRGQKPRPFSFENNPFPTDEELLVWADQHLRKELEPCVEQVIALDKNNQMYDAMLKQKFIVNPDIMSGVYPMRGVAIAHSILTNPPIWIEEQQ